MKEIKKMKTLHTKVGVVAITSVLLLLVFLILVIAFESTFKITVLLNCIKVYTVTTLISGILVLMVDQRITKLKWNNEKWIKQYYLNKNFYHLDRAKYYKQLYEKAKHRE